MIRYAGGAVTTIADFTAVGAFVGIAIGVIVERRLDQLDRWVSLGIFAGGAIGCLVSLLDGLI